MFNTTQHNIMTKFIICLKISLALNSKTVYFKQFIICVLSRLIIHKIHNYCTQYQKYINTHNKG